MLRPISVGAIIYRAYSTAGVADMRELLATNAPQEVHGSIARSSTLTATVDILQHCERAAADGDYCHIPRLQQLVRSQDAEKAMRQWGIPVPFARAWGAAWSGQSRWLELARAAAENPLESVNCLPQGDPAAPIALAALLRRTRS